MRRRLVSLAAILAVIAPATSVWALSPDTGSAPAAVVSAPALPQAAPLQGAPVADLVARVDIPWSRFQLDNGLTVDGGLRAGASRPAAGAEPAATPTPVSPKPAPAGADNPNSSVATYQARAAISRGDAAEASKLLEQATQLSRNDKQILCLLAGLYDATGDKLRAGSFADKCKEAGGSPERVSLPATQTGALPSQAPTVEPTAPAEPQQPAPATTIRRRVRTATGDGP